MSFSLRSVLNSSHWSFIGAKRSVGGKGMTLWTHASATRYPLPAKLQDSLSQCVATSRDSLKSTIKPLYGKRVIGEATLAQVVDGGRDIPALYAQYDEHNVAERLHRQLTAAGSSLSDLVTVSSQPALLYERVLWFLLSGTLPTEEMVQFFATHLHERRIHFLQDKHASIDHVIAALSSLTASTSTAMHRPLSGQTLLSLALLHLQPHSQLFHHRRETVKAELYLVVIEDVLDILAMFPSLLALVNAPNASTLTQWGSLTDTASFQSQLQQLLPHRSSAELSSLLVRNLLTSFDGSKALIHIPRLVSCTLSDPWLATSSLCNAFPRTPSRLDRDSDETDELLLRFPLSETSSPSSPSCIPDELAIALLSRVTAGLVEVFWDRALMFSLENPKSLDLPSLMSVVEESFEKNSL